MIQLKSMYRLHVGRAEKTSRVPVAARGTIVVDRMRGEDYGNSHE
jgi:hypothetical protein